MPSWDLPLLEKINHGWSHPVLDWLMPAVSAINAWVPLLVVIVLLILWRGGRKARLMILCLAVAVGLSDGVISNVLKKSIGRVRPRDAVAGLIVRDLGPGKPEFMRLFQAPVQEPSKVRKETRGKSLPSSHTVNMFALATVIALFYRGWGAFAYGLAFLVALSRLYVAAHWPSDVAISLGLGVLIGWGTVKAILGFLERRARRPNAQPAPD